MPRRVRLKLLGTGWHSHGGAPLPDDRVIVVTEEEAAAFMRERGTRHSVEFVEFVDDDSSPGEPLPDSDHPNA